MTDRGFEEFFRVEHRKLVALGAAMTGSIEIGQDLAQDVLARAYKHWSKIAQYDNAGAWVRRVLINMAIDANRRRGRESAAMQQLSATDVLLPTDASADGWWRAVRSLPDQQRAAIVMYYLEDRSVAGVAQLLGVAEGTVKSTLSKARATLAVALREVDTS